MEDSFNEDTDNSKEYSSGKTSSHSQMKRKKGEEKKKWLLGLKK
jgi:hypothetical protein